MIMISIGQEDILSECVFEYYREKEKYKNVELNEKLSLVCAINYTDQII